MIIGIVFLLVGVVGFVKPDLMGTHLSLAHNLVHIISGAIALFFGLAGSLPPARNFCFIFGSLYGLLGVAGFALGTRGTDPRLFTIIPGILELGRMDHTIHIMLGILFIIGAVTTAAEPQSV